MSQRKGKNVSWIRPVLEYLSKQNTYKSYNQIINEAHLCARDNKRKVLRQSRVCPTPNHFYQVVRNIKEIKRIKLDNNTSVYQYQHIDQIKFKEERYKEINNY